MLYFPPVNPTLTLTRTISFEALQELMRKIAFRGLYSKEGKRLNPYRNANFRKAQLLPSGVFGGSPELVLDDSRATLFTSQPTVYENQIEIITAVDEFLREQDIDLTALEGAVEYLWEGRGVYHMTPPVIEKHTYNFRNGYIDLDDLISRFQDTYIKDARGNLHHLGQRELNSFYIDEVSKLDHLDIFNSNAPAINYGFGYNGQHAFYVACDGTHRMDYSLEVLQKPITVLVAEPGEGNEPLIPYYALPVPFSPVIRLSSKKAEQMYHRLERDKIHLLNDFIKKVIHYNWEVAGLEVSKLRTNVDVY